jgi:hypothetical protein
LFPPPYTQSWTCQIKLSFVWVVEAVLRWSPIPQLWGSGNGCLWTAACNTAWLLQQQNFKLIPRWDKCINALRHYVEKLMVLLQNKWAIFNTATTTPLQWLLN